nr:NmrA/HSCARG family protein [Rhodococcus wratislaviensis]GLK38485.1 NmrA family transcriptional regulator [Rhodococcus wratislaviensis]
MTVDLSELKNRSVLVTGATGMQGGSVARNLSREGASVSALVRDPGSEAAVELEKSGVNLIKGDLEDSSSLRAACAGHDAVFSVQLAPSPTNPTSERDQANNLITAARDTKVAHFVHSSVSGTGWRRSHPEANSGGTDAYWDSKEAVEDAVRSAGFPVWTILKPAFFMENFVAPKAAHMFPFLSNGEIVVACGITTTLAMVSGDDFGKAAATVVADPARFAKAEIELSSTALSFAEIANTCGDVTGVRTKACSASPEKIEERLGHRYWSGMQIWLEAVGYPARPEHAAAFGIDIGTSFRDWLSSHQ